MKFKTLKSSLKWICYIQQNKSNESVDNNAQDHSHQFRPIGSQLIFGRSLPAFRQLHHFIHGVKDGVCRVVIIFKLGISVFIDHF